MLRLAVNFDRDYFLTGSKLYPYLPRAWLRHIPRLRAAQTLKPMCRLKPTRMRTVRRRFCRSNHCFKPCIETSLAALS
ncbi:hypothetical protein NEICINOT_03124 [Neisseria cinerea ATCC 14685]|uniref:Uncharacterized protein n=1 Tax=Neisseria cinerea ATCC 14685 TaxID=546262 RepID=D0W0F8_NEICI|nr:hypothetical protein NEICINOT_03124 [Neisseria cinerea ATCC 14685]